MNITGVLFDFMGTTAVEKDSLVIHRCFVKAFKENGINIPDEIIRRNRGLDKKELIALILENDNRSIALLPVILNSFNSQLKNNLHNFSENKSTRDIIYFLKKKNVKTGLGSGFPRDIFEMIINHLQWNDMGFDYTGTAEEVGRGRPHPDMILDMLNKFQLKPEEFLKVGDTVADIKEGKNAGVKTAVILSGTQNENDLRSEEPDFVIHDLMELEKIIDN